MFINCGLRSVMRSYLFVFLLISFLSYFSCDTAGSQIDSENMDDADSFIEENKDIESDTTGPDAYIDNEQTDEVPGDITVEKISVDYSTQSYLLSCGNRLIVIDPGSKPESIESVVSGRNVEYLLLTHGHFDHIMGLDKLKELHPDALVAIHELDRDFLYDPSLNMSSHYISVDHVFSGKVDFEFTDSDTIRFCGKDIKIIHLPGHTPGSSGFYVDDFVVDGDTLMYMKIGVIDLPHSDKDQLIESIKTKLFTLDDDTIVYPGHGRSTTIGFEKDNNPEFAD